MTGNELALHGEDDRALARLMARARIISKVPGLRRELADNPDAVAGIMLSLEGYGLPTTIPGINNSFDWIEGQAVLSAQAYQALAAQAGYRLVPVVRTAERAVVRVRSNDLPEPIEVEFTIDEAKRARRLDEWVEQWEQQNNKWKLKSRLVIRVDGEAVNEPWPAWAVNQINAGRVKRYEAWWSYRADMLFKSAAKRAIKVAAPHVLLGAGSDTEHQISGPGAGWESPSPPASTSHDRGDNPAASPGPESPDEDITDAELVDEPAEQTEQQWDPDDPGRPFE